MTFFYSFTDSLKGKWLQFFKINRDWIKLHMEVESVYTPDGGKRPPSYLILGVVNALEPKLAQLMLPFSRLNPDADTLVEVLGLHFDPDVALGNRLQPQSGMVEESEDSDDSEYAVDAVSYEEAPQEVVADNADTSMQDVMSAESTDGITGLQMSDEVDNGMTYASAVAFEEPQAINQDDAFGDISFDDLKDSQTANLADEVEGNIEEQMFDDIGASTDDAFDDVIRDVWSEESASQNGEASNQFEEEMSTDAIDNMEVAEIFSQN